MRSTGTLGVRARSSRACGSLRRSWGMKSRRREGEMLNGLKRGDGEEGRRLRLGLRLRLRAGRRMAKRVRIPTPLRKLTNNEEVVEVKAATIGDAITELQSRYPGIKERLIDDNGDVRRFVNVYVNEEDIRFLQNQLTPLKDGDEISIIPAIAGG